MTAPVPRNLKGEDWSGIYKDRPMKLRQSRISVLKKINGQWKFALVAIYEIPGA